MPKNKTTQTAVSVTDFINSVADDIKRKDSFEIVELMRSLTGLEPCMWGPTIIGFGSLHYTYDSGHEGDVPLIGFSPRKDAIVLYLASTFDRKDELLQQFGKYKTGKSCIYVKKLADINMDILKEMIVLSLNHTSLTNQPC